MTVKGEVKIEVKVILAREGIQLEHVEGDRTDVPIDFRLLEGLLKTSHTTRPGIKDATLPEALHEEEEEVADPRAGESKSMSMKY